jgi:hypothetical protein
MLAATETQEITESPMRAVWLKEYGGAEALIVTDRPEPAPGPGQVLIDVEYANITLVETQIRAGNAPFPVHLPMIPGNGVGGTVIELGPGTAASSPPPAAPADTPNASPSTPTGSSSPGRAPPPTPTPACSAGPPTAAWPSNSPTATAHDTRPEATISA